MHTDARLQPVTTNIWYYIILTLWVGVVLIFPHPPQTFSLTSQFRTQKQKS